MRKLFNKKVFFSKLFKVIVSVAFILLIIATGSTITATAVNDESKNNTTSALTDNQIYNSQYNAVGADALIDGLPKEVQKQLENIGVTSPNWQQLNSLSLGDIFTNILSTASQQAVTPLNCVVKILGVIMLLALVNSISSTVVSSSLTTVIDIVAVLTVSLLIIKPVTDLIEYACTIIKLSADFMLIFVPVMVTIMFTIGQSIQGAGNYTVVMGAGTVVSQISTTVLTPLINTYLGMTVVNGISQKVNLSGFCELVYKVAKWVLTFTVSIFTAILTMQSIVSASADSAGTKATRFAISSFVPLVGGALSEAYQTVKGCMTMLKSGVGVFAILATGTIYLPSIISSVLWLIAINISIALAGVFDMGQIIKLLRGVATVINMLIAILLCCMLIFIVSSTVMLMVGGVR